MSEPHFNGLTPAEAERLACLIEECGEVIQAATKILRHGYASFHPMSGESNRAALERELGDVRFVINQMIKSLDVNEHEIYVGDERRSDRARLYSHHNQHLFTL